MLAEVSFGEWLKRRRKSVGLTQEQLAQQLNCSTITLRKIESEERRPSAQIVERLTEIFNIPSNEQTAFLRFARGDWKSAPSAEGEEVPWRASSVSPRSNLPASLTSLIGREQELASIREYLSNPGIRLVTLIGPPGIGKTRLCLEVARAELSDFPDGVFFIALAPFKDLNLVAPTIAQTLGLVEATNQAPLKRLEHGIGEKQMLLVLDNVEHLIEEIATLISDLLLACPHLRILTTSREALRVPGEWLFPLSALSIPTDTQLQSIELKDISEFSALALFAERARAVRPDFTLNTENIQPVTSICTQLDGLPLAIELIAARIRLMSPQALLQRLSGQFSLYADGIRAASTRQKSLHGAIAWSYDLLSEEEQKLFAYLSIFSGGFTLEAVESIFSRTITNKPISDLIASLLDKSLLKRTFDKSGELRFTMLVTIQNFARDRLQLMGTEEEVRDWHVIYFLDLAEQADKEIHGPDQAEWMDGVEKEHDNYRAALEWCVSTQKTDPALNLLGVLGWAWFVRGYHSDACSWFDKICAMPDVADYPMAYGRTLNLLGIVSYSRGDYSSAQIFLEQAVSIYQALGVAGESGMAIALDQLGLVVSEVEGNLKGAQHLLEKAAELYAKCGNRSGYARALFHLGFNNQDTALALSLFERSLAVFSQLGDVWGLGRVYHGLSWLFSYQQNYAQARPMAEQALANDQLIGFKAGIVNDLIDLGMVCLAQGDDEAAIGFYQASLEISHQSGLKMDRAIASHYLGLLALHRRDYGHAITYLTESLASYPRQSQDLNVAQRLAGLAAVAGATYQPERAAKLSGAAQNITDTTDYQIPPVDRAEFNLHIQIALEQLGEARFQALAAEGRAMTMEQAIAYALENQE